ncbi:hypothetical protein ACT6P6_10660 [Priestia endophytica]|uniref:hypothetical protein n=1 Tax=Priestia filamentosa TaxID=1402861 RepID=UPI002E249E6E|nr:hypothetical protein [Priestia filamentosa]
MNWDEFMFGKCNKKDRDYQEDKYYVERKRHNDKKDRCCKEDKHENKYYVERNHDMSWDEFMFGKCNKKDRDYQEDKYYFEKKRHDDKKDRCCKEDKHEDKYYVKRNHHENKKDRYY